MAGGVMDETKSQRNKKGERGGGGSFLQMNQASESNIFKLTVKDCVKIKLIWHQTVQVKPKDGFL